MRDAASKSSQSGAFSLLFGYLSRDRRLLARALLLLLLATAADVSGPLLAKHFIDGYLLPGDWAWQPLLLLLAAYLVTQLASAWLRYRQTLSFTDIALGAVLDIRRRVFHHVLRLPIRWFDHAATGQLVSRITNDTEAVKDLYVQFLSTVLTNAVLLLGILAAMALLDLRLMLIALLLIPGVIGVIFLYQRLSGAAVAETRQQRSEINSRISESIAGMAVIQAGNQQARFSAEFEQLNQRYYTARVRTIKISGLLLRPAIDLLSVVVLAAIIAGFGLAQTQGAVEIGVLYAFLNYLGRFTEPLAEITQRFNLYQQAMVAGARIEALLQEAGESTGGTLPTLTQGAIALRALQFGYQPDKPVLGPLTLEIPAGSFQAIVGHTGSGKSTLLNLLLNFYQPQRGELLLDGEPLSAYSREALRSGIGLIPQEPFIIAGTLRDNIDMGRGLSAQRIADAAHQAGLDALLERLPQGLETQLGERGTRLSSGQRQQLVIARALAGSPRILLLDEATANIDSETEAVIQRALRALHGNITLIVVAHRLSTIREADRILVLSQGEVIEQGNHRQLMALPRGQYRRLYLLQQQAQRVEMASH